MTRKVSVVGPGALGCLFAQRLHQAGHTVTLVDHRGDRAERLRASGITVQSGGDSKTAKVKVTDSVPQRQELVLVLCKAHRTHALRLPANTPVLTLQNGLGNAEKLCDLVGSAQVLAGTTSEASTLLEEGVVRHVAAGKTSFGSWTTCDPEPAADILRQAGFEVDLTNSPGQAIWEKVAISNGINPVTALLGVPNGALLQAKESRQLIRDLVVEASKIAALEGYRFSYSLVERAEEVCRDTAENISSMAQDIRAGRRTEIEEISGEIIRRGEHLLLPCPRTRVMYQLIKSIEQK